MIMIYDINIDILSILMYVFQQSYEYGSLLPMECNKVNTIVVTDNYQYIIT